MWDKPYQTPSTPSITSVNPSPEAKAGVNTISILGHNFIIAASDTLTPDTTIVYFNTLQATIISLDSNRIIVRRPDFVSDSCTVKVSVHNAIVEPTFGPYKIDQVSWQYGGFLQNRAIAGIATDDQGHVFVTGDTLSPYNLYETTSATDNRSVGTVIATGAPAEAPWGSTIGPDGSIYIFTGVSTRWVSRVYTSNDSIVQKWLQLPKVVKFGDVSPGGFLFTGGVKTDLYVISPGMSGQITSSQAHVAGFYAADTIFAIKAYDGYLYVAWKSASLPSSQQISRHAFTSDSTLGPQELVLDMSNTRYANDRVSGLAFSASGDMYISTASNDPLLVDPGAGSDGAAVDGFYQGILPPFCGGISWNSNSDYLYMISGNGSNDNPWTVYKVDMGEVGGH